MSLETDVQEFLQAATPLKDKVWISRDTHVACRKFLVACQIIAPGADGDRHQYGVALLELLRTKQLPTAPPPAGPTPEELAAEQARRSKGVMFRDEEWSEPGPKDESVFQDPRLRHNAHVDAEMQRREERSRAHAFASKLDGLGEAIPGLRDEYDEVLVGGKVARYATSELQKANREHNAKIRTEWTAKKAAAEKSKQRGL